MMKREIDELIYANNYKEITDLACLRLSEDQYIKKFFDIENVEFCKPYFNSIIFSWIGYKNCVS